MSNIIFEKNEFFKHIGYSLMDEQFNLLCDWYINPHHPIHYTAPSTKRQMGTSTLIGLDAIHTCIENDGIEVCIINPFKFNIFINIDKKNNIELNEFLDNTRGNKDTYYFRNNSTLRVVTTTLKNGYICGISSNKIYFDNFFDFAKPLQKEILQSLVPNIINSKNEKGRIILV